MGSFLSDTFFESFSSTENMFISILMIQILHNFTNSWIFIDVGRNCLLGNRKKTAKILMRSFTCRSTFLCGCYPPSWKEVGEGGVSPTKAACTLLTCVAVDIYVSKSMLRIRIWSGFYWVNVTASDAREGYNFLRKRKNSSFMIGCSLCLLSGCLELPRKVIRIKKF